MAAFTATLLRETCFPVAFDFRVEVFNDGLLMLLRLATAGLPHASTDLIVLWAPADGVRPRELLAVFAAAFLVTTNAFFTVIFVGASAFAVRVCAERGDLERTRELRSVDGDDARLILAALDGAAFTGVVAFAVFLDVGFAELGRPV